MSTLQLLAKSLLALLMYVCMYVCVYVCMYECMYVWMYVCSVHLDMLTLKSIGSTKLDRFRVKKIPHCLQLASVHCFWCRLLSDKEEEDAPAVSKFRAAVKEMEKVTMENIRLCGISRWRCYQTFLRRQSRVTRLGEILLFGLLFKGLGNFLGENIVCCRY
jgi:hypothetical protein